MARKFSSLKTIAYLSAFVYFLLAAGLWNMSSWTAMSIYQQIMFGILVFLCVSSLGVTGMRIWGRRGVVYGNLLAVLFLAVLFRQEIALPIPWQNVFFFAAMSLFFSQKSIKASFRYLVRNKWECILMVDDDMTSIKTVRPVLVNAGYSVITANTGEEGLAQARAHCPDLILLDVILPGIKGRDVCRFLKEDEKTRDIPVIFLTAKNSPDDIRAEIDAGGETHLTKPVSARTLISTVHKVLNRCSGV